jgi:hypothetical protein
MSSRRLFLRPIMPALAWSRSLENIRENARLGGSSTGLSATLSESLTSLLSSLSPPRSTYGTRKGRETPIFSAFQKSFELPMFFFGLYVFIKLPKIS